MSGCGRTAAALGPTPLLLLSSTGAGTPSTLTPTALTRHRASLCRAKRVALDQLTYGPLQNLLFMSFMSVRGCRRGAVGDCWEGTLLLPVVAAAAGAAAAAGCFTRAMHTPCLPHPAGGDRGPQLGGHAVSRPPPLPAPCTADRARRCPALPAMPLPACLPARRSRHGASLIIF